MSHGQHGPCDEHRRPVQGSQDGVQRAWGYFHARCLCGRTWTRKRRHAAEAKLDGHLRAIAIQRRKQRGG